MKNWFITLVSCAFFITLIFSMNKAHEGETLIAHQTLNEVWRAFENVKSNDFDRIHPHAILYDGGTEMDVFVTFRPGFLTFVSKKEEVPVKSRSYWSWNATYANFCHFQTPTSLLESQYTTQNIYISDIGSCVPIGIDTWCYYDADEVVKLYACEHSAVFRLSLAMNEAETFTQDLASSITKPLQEGIYMVVQKGSAQRVDWRIEEDIINLLVKTQGHKFIKYNTGPYYKRFQTSVAECRAERKAARKE